MSVWPWLAQFAPGTGMTGHYLLSLMLLSVTFVFFFELFSVYSGNPSWADTEDMLLVLLGTSEN